LYKFFVHVRHPSYRLVISADAPFPAGAFDPSVVAVLRPLIFYHRRVASLDFFALRAALNFACGALFRENSAMTREAWIIGSETRGGQQSGAIEDLGPGQFGQCAESTLVPA